MKLNQLLRTIDLSETTLILTTIDDAMEEHMEYEKGKYDEGIFWMIRKCDVIRIAPKNNKLYIEVDTKKQGLPM